MSEPASSHPQSSNRTHNRTLLILGLLLNLFLALAPLGAWGDRIFGKRHLIGHEVFWWCAVLLMLGYVVFVEHRRMSSIGFRRPRVLDLVLATVFGILMVVGIVFIYRAVFPALHLQMNTGVMSSLLATPFWYRLLLVTRAAASEEILFRGYPIERLLELTRQPGRGRHPFLGSVHLCPPGGLGMGATDCRWIRRSAADNTLFVATKPVGKYARPLDCRRSRFPDAALTRHHASNWARSPRDRSTATAFESKETNSSAPSQCPS